MNDSKATKIIIFNAIKSGVNTLTSISEKTGLSMLTACRITSQLTKMKLIKCETHPENYSGRRTNYYSINDSYFSVFIEQINNCFNCISIDINGNVVKRLDFVMSKNASLNDNIKRFYTYLVKKRIINDLCLGIFVVCDQSIENLLLKNIQVTTKEDIIINFLSEDDKMILFTLNGKHYISAYGHIHYPEKGIGEKTISKTLHIDKHYEFSEELYDGIFLSLSKYTYDNLHKQIK